MLIHQTGANPVISSALRHHRAVELYKQKTIEITIIIVVIGKWLFLKHYQFKT